MMRKCLRILLPFLVLTGASVFGQVNTATLTGTVTDATGGSVPAAEVKLRSSNSGLVRSETTDGSGRYSFQFVIAGPYVLSVAAAGFQQESRSLTLTAAQNADIAIPLSVKNEVTDITVREESPLVDTSSVALQSTVESMDLNQLPVAHQDWTGLLQIGAGQTKLTTAQASGGVGTFGAGLNINGLPSTGYNLTVDGTNATSDPEYVNFNFYQAPNIINTVNNDAIQEVSLTKGIAPATVGNTLSGSINLITKSGTNQIHGSAYEISEASLYDARNPFLAAKPRTTFNEYGGSFGAPILKNRLFFFGSYEGARLSASKTISGTVPTPYLIGISPAVYQPVLALFPSVAQPAGQPAATTTVYSGTGRTSQTDGNAVGRVDYYLNGTNLFAVRYIRARPYLLAPALLASNPRTTIGHTDALNANYTHFAQSGWTTNTRFGYNRIRLDRVDSGFVSNLQSLSFGFSTGGIIGAFLQRGSFTTVEQSFAKVISGHSIQIGGIFQRQQAGRLQLQASSLSYSNLSQWLADTPGSATIRLFQFPKGTPSFTFTDYQYGLYLQDDWHVSQHLTINVGVRYDLFTVPQEILGRAFNRDIDPARPQLGPGFGPFRPQDSLFNGNHKDFQPRIGLAWTPGDNQRTVFRAGFGILTQGHNLFSGPMNIWAPTGASPITLQLTQTQLSSVGLNYPYDASQYLNTVSQLQGKGVLSTNLAFITLNPNNPNPYSIQYQAGVERVLPGSMGLNVNYIGTRGLREVLYQQLNQPDRVTGIQPAPGFSPFNYFNPVDRSRYDGLQLTLKHPLQHGLQYSVNYTWGHVTSFGNADLLQETGPQDNNNIKAEHGPAPFDIRQRFVTNAIYQLPFDKLTRSSQRWVKTLLDGWQLSGLLSAQTGLPVNASNSASSNYPYDRPDVNSSVSPYLDGYSSGTHQYLNPAAFITVPSNASGTQIRPGNAGRYALRAPGLWNMDATLAKTFAVSEKVHLQVRAETFNTLNHTNLTGLITTANTNTFGRLTSASARTMQLFGRITF